jgi:hypothetical protein
MTQHSKKFSVAFLLVTCLATLFGSCNKDERSNGPAATTPQVSAVQVEKQADGIHIKTAEAEFVLTANGNLLARRNRGSEPLTLDGSGSNPGIVVTSGKKAIGDFGRDLIHTEIREANGKLGKLGKRVDVKGYGASARLDGILDG